jgi:hypothetical protein
MDTELKTHRTALIVARGPDEGADLTEVLESDGWTVLTCSGPGAGDCPAEVGRRCSLRTSVDAAAVYIDPTGPEGALGALPRLVCAADEASVAVVAVEGSLSPPRFVGRTATVGKALGGGAIARAISKLLEEEDEN